VSGTSKITVEFVQKASNKSVIVKVDAGAKLTFAAHLAKVDLPQKCAGKAKCTTCRVKVLTESEGCLSKLSEEEKLAIGNVFHITKERLACQSHVLSDLKVEIPLPKDEEKS